MAKLAFKVKHLNFVWRALKKSGRKIIARGSDI